MYNVNEINGFQLMNLIEEDRYREIVVVDVRELEEIQLGIIENAVHIPLATIPKQMEQFDRNKNYVFICQSGIRSYHAAEYISKHGFRGTNVRGGMLEWPGKTIK